MRIGIDLGGTKIEAIALSPAGQEITRLRVATPRDYAASLDAIAGLVRELERAAGGQGTRSEEHTSELQSQSNLVCRLLLEKISAATRFMNENYAEGQRYVTVGRKGRDFLLRYRRQVVADVSGIADRPTMAQILPAINVALDEYTKGNTDAVILCYSKWISTMRQEPTVQTLIPAEIPKRDASQQQQQGPRGD